MDEYLRHMEERAALQAQCKAEQIAALEEAKATTADEIEVCLAGVDTAIAGSERTFWCRLQNGAVIATGGRGGLNAT